MSDDDDRTDPVIRKGALLLSALALTPDHRLDAFRDRRTARPDAGLEDLRRARAILDGVSFILRSSRRDDWAKLEPAFEALRAVAPPPPEKDPGPAQRPPEAAPTPAKPSRPEQEGPSVEKPDGPARSSAADDDAEDPVPRLPSAGLARGSVNELAPAVAPSPFVAPAPAPFQPPSSFSPSAPFVPPGPPPAPVVPPGVAPGSLGGAPQSPGLSSPAEPSISPLVGPGPNPPPAAVASLASPPVGVTASKSPDAIDQTCMPLAVVSVDLPFQASDGPAFPPIPAADALPPRQDNIISTTAGIVDLGAVLPFLDDRSPHPDAGAPPSPDGEAPPPHEEGEPAAAAPSRTLEQYATFRAELAFVSIRDADAVYRRHQLDRAAAAALDAEWRVKLTDDAELRSRFEDLMARYSSWLRANRAPS